jgi:hypothetical protein
MNYSRFSKTNYTKDSVGLKQSSYIKSCKVGKRFVTGAQQLLIEKMLKSDKLTAWESKFLKSAIEFKKFSQSQKSRLNKIYIKTQCL